MLEAAYAHDTTGGMESVGDLLAEGLPLVVGRDDAGAMVAAYVPCWSAAHRNLHIAAAAGAGPVDMTRAIGADAQARAARLGADFLSCHTRRPGLVRKLERDGWTVHGFILRKLMKAKQ